MSDRTWVQIVSWHVIRNFTRVPGRVVTVCGRTFEGPTSDTLPSGKSCESCLRLVAREDDR